MAGKARDVKALLVVLPLAVLMAGCGRIGPVRPPGPPDRITYPRAYPAPERPRAQPAEPQPPAGMQQRQRGLIQEEALGEPL